MFGGLAPGCNAKLQSTEKSITVIWVIIGFSLGYGFRV